MKSALCVTQKVQQTHINGLYSCVLASAVGVGARATATASAVAATTCGRIFITKIKLLALWRRICSTQAAAQLQGSATRLGNDLASSCVAVDGAAAVVRFALAQAAGAARQALLAPIDVLAAKIIVTPARVLRARASRCSMPAAIGTCR